MFFGEIVAASVDNEDFATVNPGAIRARDVKSETLLADGDVFAEVGFDVVGLEGGAIPGGFFLGEGEAFARRSGEGHGDFTDFGNDAGEGVVSGDIRRVDGVDAGLHSGDANREIGHAEVDEVGDGANSDDSATEGKRDAFDTEERTVFHAMGFPLFFHGSNGFQSGFDGLVFFLFHGERRGFDRGGAAQGEAAADFRLDWVTNNFARGGRNGFLLGENGFFRAAFRLEGGEMLAVDFRGESLATFEVGGLLFGEGGDGGGFGGGSGDNWTFDVLAVQSGRMLDATMCF